MAHQKLREAVCRVFLEDAVIELQDLRICEPDIAELIDELDLAGTGSWTKEEWRRFLNRSDRISVHTDGEPTEPTPQFAEQLAAWGITEAKARKELMASLAEHADRTKFLGLMSDTGGCEIELTENRAIELRQLEKMYDYVECELGGKGQTWVVSHKSHSTQKWETVEIGDPKMVNLYDLNCESSCLHVHVSTSVLQPM